MKEWNGFRKGVNLGGWLSQCDYSRERLDNFIKEEDFKWIAENGFDHVRVPIDYNVVEDDKGGYIEYGFERIAFAVDTAKKYGLNIILDLHKTAGFMFDEAYKEFGFFENEQLQERFCKLWEQLSSRFGNDPEHIAFELLNEVTDEAFMPVWNKVAYKCIERIRKNAPDTVILVGSFENNSARTVYALEKPYDDKIIYNFHCYDPLKFTHQHASWVMDKPEVQKDWAFEDCGIDEAFFEDFFKSAIEKAKENDTLLYCGEYGVIENVESSEAIKWFKAINAVFEKHDIGRAVWSYKEMDFGITDKRFDDDRDELIKYL